MNIHSSHRRAFIKQAAMVTGSFALPRPGTGQSASSPGSKLRVACMLRHLPREGWDYR